MLRPPPGSSVNAALRPLPLLLLALAAPPAQARDKAPEAPDDRDYADGLDAVMDTLVDGFRGELKGACVSLPVLVARLQEWGPEGEKGQDAVNAVLAERGLDAAALGAWIARHPGEVDTGPARWEPFAKAFRAQARRCGLDAAGGDPEAELQSLLTMAEGITTDLLPAVTRIQWTPRLYEAIADAPGLDRRVLVWINADWAAPGTAMNATTWSDPRVTELVERCYVPVLLDLTTHDAGAQEYRVKVGVEVPPAYLVLDEGGQVLSGSKQLGYVGPDAAREHLARYCPRR